MAAPTDVDLDKRVGELSLEQKVRLLTGADFWSLHPEPAVGLRRLVVSDGPAGVRGERWDERDTSANVPSPTALAATWDEARIERLGRLLAAECRRKGVDVLLAPTVNLHRTPYGGRHFECFSEDPLLTGRIGVAYVRGLQSEGVGATVKHFVANDSETQRFTLDARVDERVLRELYLAPFEVIVRDGGVWSVMAAYNGVNGATMTENPLQRDVLKDEWGFDGLIMSDWYAGRSLSAAGEGLLDLVMPGPSGPWGEALVAAVRAGEVPESAVDDKVLRLLRLASRVGALEGVPTSASAAPWHADRISAELRATAAAGFVLARNEPAAPGEEPLLPLDAGRLQSIAVLGPNAVVARTLGGGSATVFPPYTVSPLAGLHTALGPGVRIDHGRGGRSTHRLPVAPPELLHRRDGSTGVEVRFLDENGAVAGTEERNGAAFTWLSSYGEGLSMEQVRAIEVDTRLRAEEEGTHLVGASGLGSFRLTVAGEVRFDTRLTLPPGADPVEGMMRPPQESVPVSLRPGEEVEVVLRYEPASSGGFGEAELHMVMFQLNVAVEADDDAELEKATALARQADVAVVVVGTTEEVESEGFDRTSLALPGRQDELVRRVVQANPRTIVVVNAGAPVLLPWADDAPAVLLAWFPGQEFGNALADVLLGVVEPGGRSPVTWPSTEEGLPSTQPVDGRLDYAEGLFIGYRSYDREGREPRFRFGHGLGYTTWEYLSAAAGDDGAGTTVTVRVRNSGTRPGREVVQVYASRPDSAIERPLRWLVGSAGVEAEPGAETTATISVPRRAFQHWDAAAHRWTDEPGIFRLHVGSSSGVLPLGCDVDVAGRA